MKIIMLAICFAICYFLADTAMMLYHMFGG